MNTVCDTIYTLKNTGNAFKANYVRESAEVVNCREVAADCQVTYKKERSTDGQTETVRAETSGCSEVGTNPSPETPEVKTKTVCDTVYAVKNTGNAFKPNYVRGEVISVSCREVAEDCEVTYVLERAEDNTTETEKAVTDCEE